MFYSDEIIEEVRTRNDIVDVIGQVVHLERKGANYFGLCPFHSEKSPSFSVRQSTQLYHCFGCGESGNVFTFVMKYENLSFPEAVRSLAERAGLQLPEEEVSPGAREARNRKETLFRINREAARYYYLQLRGDSGRRGLEYFIGRGLTDETMRRFGLGFADVGGNLLTKHLRKAGFTDAEIMEAGLAAHDEKRGLYDKFWNRVIFPILDVGNRVIGFGGRVLGDAKPKYLNTQETPIFDKGRNLYGLNYAKTSRAGHMILCEGYMDVIAMHQAGFPQALASLGTAFTEMQGRLLRRYTGEVILSYDSDDAGIKAAMRAIAILKQTGLRGRVLNLSPYKDPDEFIRAEGREAFAERLKQAEGTWFFELRVTQRGYDLQDPEGRTRFFKEIAGKLCEFEEAIERDSYITATAKHYGIPPEDLRQLVAKSAADRGIVRAAGNPVRTPQGADGKYISPAERKHLEEEKRRLMPERTLLAWLYEEPELLETVKRYLTPGDFSEGIYRDVAERMFRELPEGSFVPAAMVSAFPEEETAGRVAELFEAPLPRRESKTEREHVLEQLIRSIKGHSLERENAALDRTDPDYFRHVIEGRKRIDALKGLKIGL